jgi:hypothetical protein
MELEESHRAEVSRMNEQFETILNTLLAEKDALAHAHEDNLKALTAQVRDEKEAFKAELNSLLEIEKNTHLTLDWTADQLNNHKQSVQELLAEIQALKTSTSWRITAPFRAFLRNFSG